MVSMKTKVIVSVSPNQTNIIYSVVHLTTLEDLFSGNITTISQLSIHTPKITIYCRMKPAQPPVHIFSECTERKVLLSHKFPWHTYALLGRHAHELYDPLVQKSSHIDLQKKRHLMSLQLLLHLPFGIGIDCPNVCQNIHYGPPSDKEAYVQETGCSGHDSLSAPAVFIVKPTRNQTSEATNT